MKVRTMAQAAEAEEAAREFYSRKISTAIDNAGGAVQLAKAIGVANGMIYQLLQSLETCKLQTLRRYAEQIDKAGL